MAIAEAYTGTHTVQTTEWDLPTNSSSLGTLTAVPGSYAVVIDLSALAAGDEFILQIYEAAIGSGTKRLLDSKSFLNAQGTPMWLSEFYPLLNGWTMTLKKVAGTDRSIIWSIRKYG